MNVSRIVASALCIVAAAAVASFSAVPGTITYQGYLKDSAGIPVTAPTSIRFSLYSSNPARNNPVWRETKSVTPANGIYSTQLGSITSLTAMFDVPYWLGVKVAGDGEMPLQPLASVPYALRSGTVTDNTVTSNSISGTIAANKLDLSTVVKKAGDAMSGTLTLPAATVTGTAQVGTLRFSGDGSTMTSAGLIPPMNGPFFLNAVFGGDLKNARTANSVVLSKDITVTRVQVTLRDPGQAACWPRPVISVSDGTKGIRIPLNDASRYDTGELTLPLTAGSNLAVQLLSARMTVTCSSGYPADANVTIEYRLKAPGDAAACGTEQLSCNGFCTTTSGDPDNCASCANACPGGSGCVTGFCSNYCPTGQTVCTTGGKCIDTGKDLNNCGACGIACTSGQICANGSCVDVACTAGQTACPTLNGAVCVNTLTDSANCGACGFDCKYAVTGAATVACVSGSCQAATCAPGWGNCDGNLANGCETSLETSQNCGACGTVCTSGICQHAVSCFYGYCGETAQLVCSSDNVTGNACSATFDKSSSYYTCWMEPYTVSYVTGLGSSSYTAYRSVCGYKTVGTNYQVNKCDDANPCTTDACTSADVGCSHAPLADGAACSPPFSSSSTASTADSSQSACKAGACLPLCPAGQGHCGAAQECVDIMSNGVNCGSCGRICKSMATCQDGSCVCLPPYSDCGVFCKNLTNDVDHCGACGNKCTGGYPCTDSECKCPTGTTMCNGTCVNTSTSESSCGGCGITCPSNQYCNNGTCATCVGLNYGLCTSFGGDRYCANFSNDRNNCGGCGNRCSLFSPCISGRCL